MKHVVNLRSGRVVSEGRRLRSGDRLIPESVRYEHYATDGDPGFAVEIRVMNGVPRCTAVHIDAADGGEEVRPKHLKAIKEGLERLVEDVVALVSQEIVDEVDGRLVVTVGDDADKLRASLSHVSTLRAGSRRAMTDARRHEIARIYNGVQSGGLEAIETAFGVSRSAAANYLREAKKIDGLILPVEERGQDDG